MIPNVKFSKIFQLKTLLKKEFFKKAAKLEIYNIMQNYKIFSLKKLFFHFFMIPSFEFMVKYKYLSNFLFYLPFIVELLIN